MPGPVEFEVHCCFPSFEVLKPWMNGSLKVQKKVGMPCILWQGTQPMNYATPVSKIHQQISAQKLEASLASLPWPPPQEVAGILVQPCCKLGFSFEVLHVYSSQRRRLCALLFTLRFPYAGKLVVCVRPLLEKSCWRASPRHQGLIVNTELSPPFTDEIADVDVHSCTCIA